MNKPQVALAALVCELARQVFGSGGYWSSPVVQISAGFNEAAIVKNMFKV